MYTIHLGGGGQFETYNLLNFTYFIGAICLTAPTSCGKATIRKGCEMPKLQYPVQYVVSGRKWMEMDLKHLLKSIFTSWRMYDPDFIVLNFILIIILNVIFYFYFYSM